MWRWTLYTRIPNHYINAFILVNKRNLSDSKWKILFFGTDHFSLVSLQDLHKAYTTSKIIDKLEVVSNMVGRTNVITKFAKEHDIYLHQWPIKTPTINEFDLGIVVSFGYLIPKRIINSFPLGMLNVHGSLLPRWRGAAPIIHCLLNGDTRTGVSIMRINPHHFDTGDILNQKEVEINRDTLQPELHRLLAEAGSKALMECLCNLPKYLENAQTQDDSKATYAPKISQSLSIVNWEKSSAIQIYNLSRALNGIYPLMTQYKDYHIKFKNVQLSDENHSINLIKPPGHFEFVKEKKVISVWCNDGKQVYLNSIKVHGRAEMSALDFRNGFMKNVSLDQLHFKNVEIE